MDLTECFLPQCVGWRMGQEGNVVDGLLIFLGIFFVSAILHLLFSKGE